MIGYYLSELGNLMHRQEKSAKWPILRSKRLLNEGCIMEPRNTNAIAANELMKDISRVTSFLKRNLKSDDSELVQKEVKGLRNFLKEIYKNNDLISTDKLIQMVRVLALSRDNF